MYFRQGSVAKRPGGVWRHLGAGRCFDSPCIQGVRRNVWGREGLVGGPKCWPFTGAGLSFRKSGAEFGPKRLKHPHPVRSGPFGGTIRPLRVEISGMIPGITGK
ncbi:MAG: hypothetical protein CW342_07045 [Thermoactinomycetaceae bacterium]|nr:hypothetical protein [Bacillota bacterium]MBO2532641.1 hypothetical protein [Thermoactinomycetaceae bacterium]